MYGQIAEFHSQFYVRDAQFKESAAANCALVEDLRTVKDALNDSKTFFLEEADRVVDWKLKFVAKESSLLSVEAARSAIAAQLKKMTDDRNTLITKVAGPNLSRARGVPVGMLSEFRGLTKKVERAVMRAFEGLDELDGAGKVKEKEFM